MKINGFLATMAVPAIALVVSGSYADDSAVMHALLDKLTCELTAEGAGHASKCISNVDCDIVLYPDGEFDSVPVNP